MEKISERDSEMVEIDSNTPGPNQYEISFTKKNEIKSFQVLSLDQLLSRSNEILKQENSKCGFMKKYEK